MEVVSGKFNAREPGDMTQRWVWGATACSWMRLGWPMRKVIIAALLRLD